MARAGVASLSLTVLILMLPSLSFARPGFLKANDPSIPAPVREAAKSVYRINAQAGRLVTTIDMQELKQRREFEELMRWNPSVTSLRLQYEFCQNEQLRFCPVFQDDADGSAFLLGDQSTLVTNLHNFVEAISAQVVSRELRTRDEIDSQLSNLPLYFSLKDANLQPIYNSHDSPSRLTFFNADPFLLNSKDPLKKQSTLVAHLSDVVEVNLKASLLAAKPLRLAESPAEVGDQVYLIGYPIKTEDRKRLFGASDSDGKQVISEGVVIDPLVWEKKTDQQPGTGAFVRGRLVVGDFDSDHGNSGGPILNARGEVVGIFYGFNYDHMVEPIARYSTGLALFDKAVLKDLWKMLDTMK